MMSTTPVLGLESVLDVLSRYGPIRSFRFDGAEVYAEFFEKSVPSESGQATAPAAAPAIATPAQSGNSDEPVKLDILDVLNSGSPIPGAPDRGNLSGS